MSVYVYQCIGCNRLDQADRRDVIACSPACRVKAHRNGSSKALRDFARRIEVTPGIMLQARAIHAMRPDLAKQVADGALTIEDVQPAMAATFAKLLFSAIDGCNESSEALEASKP